MTNFSQKLFVMLLLAIGIAYGAPWLLSALPPEPADGALLICGFMIGVFIARQRLFDERFIR